jgi:hypothetical protein
MQAPRMQAPGIEEPSRIGYGAAVSPTFLKIVILGLPLLFSLLWFAYWVVKLYKGPKKKDAPADAAGRGARDKGA